MKSESCKILLTYLTNQRATTRDEHGSELDRTGSGLKPILAGSGLDRTASFFENWRIRTGSDSEHFVVFM